MSRPMKVRCPTTVETRRLHELGGKLTNRHQQRRAEALWLYGLGLSPSEIAAAQAVHVNTIYRDLHAFAQAGLAAIEQLHAAGVAARLTATQAQMIVRLTDQSPQVVGLPYGRWSLRKLRAYLLKHRIVRALSAERLRQVLKKRYLFSPRPAQTREPRSATARHFGPDSLGFPAFAPPRAIVVFRCQTHRGQSLWRPPLHFGQTPRLAAQPENARTVLSLHLL